jgi:hypothetical protein
MDGRGAGGVGGDGDTVLVPRREGEGEREGVKQGEEE